MIKKYIPEGIRELIPKSLKKQAKKTYRRSDWRGNHQIFCISMQKTATTSVGDFFLHFGYPVCKWHRSWKNRWTHKWYSGDFEAIFSSKDFKERQVFEDDPWWCPDFYKVLYERFPKAKFVLFTRDPDRWFDSMMKHANGKSLGNTLIHSRIYNREEELMERMEQDPSFKPHPDLLDNLLDMHGMDAHYKAIYNQHNEEVKAFFQERKPEALFCAQLEDPEKWQKLGRFFGISVPADFEIHSNKSNVKSSA